MPKIILSRSSLDLGTTNLKMTSENKQTKKKLFIEQHMDFTAPNVTKSVTVRSVVCCCCIFKKKIYRTSRGQLNKAPIFDFILPEKQFWQPATESALLYLSCLVACMRSV